MTNFDVTSKAHNGQRDNTDESEVETKKTVNNTAWKKNAFKLLQYMLVEQKKYMYSIDYGIEIHQS